MASRKTAACSSERNDDDAESQQNQVDELDFFSPKFNPRRALLAPNVDVPFGNIKTFTSVQSYHDAVIVKRKQTIDEAMDEKDSRSSNTKRTGGSKTSESVSRSSDKKSLTRFSSRPSDTSGTELSATASVDSKTESFRGCSHDKPDSFGKQREKSTFHGRESQAQEAERNRRNIFTKMASMDGPLHLLQRCAEERLHVRIMTRGAAVVKSVCRGYIVAFDSHFNMALIDVDEFYRRPAALGKVRARRNEKLKAAQKELQQERNELVKQMHPTDKEIPLPMEISYQAHQDSSWDEGKEALNQEKGSEPSGKSSCEDSLGASVENIEKDSGVENITASQSTGDSGVLTSKMTPIQREALIMGIPEENVECRHVNQILIRGENIVLVSIMND